MVRIDSFGVGKYIGERFIKPVVNIVEGTLWGVFMPSPGEDICGIDSPSGRLGLTPEAHTDLEQVVKTGSRVEFVKRLKFWEQILALDPVKVAYAITTCLAAMKWGSTDAVRGVCLNLLGSSFFK